MPNHPILRFSIFLIVLLTACAGGDGAAGPDRNEGERPWNILLIETDDQRWDTLWAMPAVRRRLVERGVVFENAFVSNPICCPSRSSLLSGGYYSHNVNVLTVAEPNGGALRFDDRETLATALQRAGYKTAIVGKYLNGYRHLSPRIPPGWSFFFAKVGPGSHYQRHHMLQGTSTPDAYSWGRVGKHEGYGTDLERDQALAFLAGLDDGEPFFLWLSTQAPHRPAVPAPQDRGAFPDFEYRGRAWGEEDLSDKPAWVTYNAGVFAADFGEESEGPLSPRRPEEDEGESWSEVLALRQVRTLVAVDRAVEALLAHLEQRGLLEHTAILYTSDNGMLWGEHRIYSKGSPYEEAIHVPLIVRLPDLPPGTREAPVAIDLDVAPTILELAGLPAAGDGASLLPLLRDTAAPWREEVFFEGFGIEGMRLPPWAALRGRRWKYVEYGSGERELYDLAEDPFELESRHRDPGYGKLVAEMAARLAPLKGLAITTADLPRARAGEPYEARLEAWGGASPYRWFVANGRLPAGLALDPGGTLQGTPRGPFRGSVTVGVRDASRSPFNGAPQSFFKTFALVVR